MTLIRLALLVGLILAPLAGRAADPASPTPTTPPPTDTAAPGTGVLRPQDHPVVVIDPGHPSETSAGRTPLHGTTELEVNWTIAHLLKQRLEATTSATVVLTRAAKDTLTTNRERAECANRHRAVVMVRLHCDVGHGTGYCLYFPDASGTVDGVTGPSAEVQEGSRAAATILQAGLREILAGRLRDNGIRTDRQTAVGQRQGALTGSIFCQVPTVTIEMVYLDNPADAAFITSPEGAAAMAEALATGITRLVSRS